MALAPQTRLPIAPVFALLHAHGRHDHDESGRAVAAPRVLARIARRPVRTILRWVTDGVPYFAADELAVSIGKHPLEIWPDFHDVTPYQQKESTP